MASSTLARHLSVLAFAIASSCCVSSSPAHAAPPRAAAPHRTSQSVHLDVVDRGTGAPHSVRLTLPISERGVSKLETQAGNASYSVRLHRQGPRDSDATISITLRRSDLRRLEREEQKRDVELDVSVHLAQGKRMVLTRLDRPDGSSTEVAATLR